MIYVAHFSNNFNSAFCQKKFYQTCWQSFSIACKEKRTNWILRIFTFNDKNPLYISLILTLQFFWESKWSRSDPISRKTIGHIPNTKNSEFKLKKCQVFLNPLLFFNSFFDFETNPVCLLSIFVQALVLLLFFSNISSF